MAALSSSFSSPPAILKKPEPFHKAWNSTSPPYGPSLVLRSSQISRSLYLYSPEDEVRPKTAKLWELPAKNGIFSLSETSPAEIPGEIVSTRDDGVSIVISALLFVAFAGLSILTIGGDVQFICIRGLIAECSQKAASLFGNGVIYIAVADFLQKRENEKFEKEEASKKKRGGKKGKVRARARAGPRGFGWKIEKDDYVDEAN
ncbi:shaggy-like protein kinase 41 [Striga asiatica]|uniref:Shaggy-like protein kinase 41 n=1 Tax=Striga asiatica TaxID=4170 RepID=A0A5A7P264_STRAF|nr:shaggy-like protein kinase 41 [Striga asiatica]